MSKSQSLTVGGIEVRQDSALYCLNDLHKAAGGERRHEINNWLSLKSTKDEVAYLEETTGITVVKITTGRNGGTYVTKDLVYSYAMWVSPKFKFSVTQAYDALVNGEIEKAKDIATRTILKDEYRPMTDSVLAHRHAQGKEAKHYHYSNEADMINRAITGMTSKQFKERFHCDSVRDNLTAEGRQAMLALQRANTALLDLDMSYEDRRGKLGEILKNRFTGKILIDAGAEQPRLAA